MFGKIAAISITFLLLVIAFEAGKIAFANAKAEDTKATQNLNDAIQMVGKASNCSNVTDPMLTQDNFGKWYLICH